MTLHTPFSSETRDGLRDFLSGFLRFGKRTTQMEHRFSGLPGSRATARLRDFSGWRKFHNNTTAARSNELRS